MTEELVGTFGRVDAKQAYFHALRVVKGRYENGESIIAQSSLYALLYAKNVLKGRFEAGEPRIAVNAFRSLEYARDVLKGRFELGEPVIKREFAFWNDYQKMLDVFEKERKAIELANRPVMSLGRLLDI